MKWKLPKPSRKWLILPPIILGILIVIFFVKNREGLKHKPEQEHCRVLRVIRVPELDVVPRVLAYGTAEPGQVWRAVAEVKGRVIETHPDLDPGSIIKRGETLLRIDPAEYELSVVQLTADIAQTAAQLDELAAQELNDLASLKIEEASFALAEQELTRLEKLVSKKAVSASAVDEQKRGVLAQRQSAQRLTNSLRLIPQQKKAIEATLAVKQARLRQAKLDLAKTVIQAPFTCRLGDFDIEQGQFLVANERLFEAHSTAISEIEAQVPLNQLRTLVDPARHFPDMVTMDMKKLRDFFNFDAIVRFRKGEEFQAEWEARVTGMREHIDAQTHTIGLVVAVDKPYEKVIPRKRPPIFQGMYCEVEFRGTPLKSRIVIPRSAIHDGHVYLVGPDNRLLRQKVKVDFVQSNFACLVEGLEKGQTLVVSDPTPAIEGMLVEPIVDKSLLEKLTDEATAKGVVK